MAVVKTTRLNERMSVELAIHEMAKNSIDATNVLMALIQNNPVKGINGLNTLDKMGVYGDGISKLWNECCSKDMDVFLKTLEDFRAGKWSRVQIHERLRQPQAQSFV